MACELVEPRQFAAKQSVIREIMLQAEEQLTGAGNVFLTDVGDGQKNASKGREKATLRRRQLKFRNAALFVPGRPRRAAAIAPGQPSIR